MKIIKKGTKTPPDKKIYVIKCKTCGCKFTYELSDICYAAYEFSFLRCPQCEYSVTIPFIKKKYKGSDREC